MKELKVGDKIKFIKPGDNWSVGIKPGEIYLLSNIAKAIVNPELRLTFNNVSTNKTWYMSDTFLNNGLVNGYFILLEEQNNTKWSCNHVRLSSDMECPVCRAFGRRTIS